MKYIKLVINAPLACLSENRIQAYLNLVRVNFDQLLQST